MFFDDDEEKLEEARYEEIQTNIQNLTLTIDVNIVVKDLFKYIKLKCTQKIRIMDILALFLSIFSIILSILLTVIDKTDQKISFELRKLLYAVNIFKDLTVVMVLVIALFMIIYEVKYWIKQNKQFKSFYAANADFTPEEIVSELMDLNNIFSFKHWNEISFHIKYYKKCKSFKRHAILIAILDYYQLPINKWNLMYLNQTINYLNKKHFRHILRLCIFSCLAIIMIILMSTFPLIFLR